MTELTHEDITFALNEALYQTSPFDILGGIDIVDMFDIYFVCRSVCYSLRRCSYTFLNNYIWSWRVVVHSTKLYS